MMLLKYSSVCPAIIIMLACCTCRPELPEQKTTAQQWNDTLTTFEKPIPHNRTDGRPYYILFSGIKEGEYWLMQGRGDNVDTLSPVILSFE